MIIPYICLGSMAVGSAGLVIIIGNQTVKLLKRTYDIMGIAKDILIDSDDIEKRREEIRRTTPLVMPSRDDLPYDFSFMEHIYSKEELLLLYHNLEKLKIIQKKSNCKDKAYYYIDDNTILLYNPGGLDHETRHMASSLGIIGNIRVCGFMQGRVWRNQFIGMGLNEGYTEWQSTRQEYLKEMGIIPLLEMFYDDKKTLEQNYFAGDLPEVIRYLSQIDGRERVLEFIRMMDKMFCYTIGSKFLDKSDKLDFLIRENLWDMYQKWSGKKHMEEVFFTPDMLNNYTPQERVRKI